jgi:SepF-like predicted cell division protein (DUF552 family)
MAAEQLIYEYSRVVDAAADPAGVVHYYTNNAQIFMLQGDQQYIQDVDVAAGDWSDYGAAAALPSSPSTFNEMRLDHPAFGQVYGIQSDMTFLLYVYAGDIGDMVEIMEIAEKADNQIREIGFSLMKTGNAMMESDVTLFLPGAEINVAVTMGEHKEYFNMGKYFLDDAPYDPFAKRLQFYGRSTLGRLKDSTFDTNAAGSWVTAAFTGTCGAIAIAILTTYSDGEIAEADIITNLVTELTATFQPKDNVLDKFNEWMLSIGWDMADLGDGRYVVGPPVELISLYRKQNYYTFMRNRDVFTRCIDRCGDGVYTRVCVKYGDPAVYYYRDVPYHSQWFPPSHKTYYVDAPEGMGQTEAELLAERIAARLQYIGIREQCVGPLRPWLIVGDVAQISDDGETATITGPITELRHQFGAQGFFTTFVTDSGGDITEVGDDLVVVTASAVYGANRKQRMTDFIRMA